MVAVLEELAWQEMAQTASRVELPSLRIVHGAAATLQGSWRRYSKAKSKTTLRGMLRGLSGRLLTRWTCSSRKGQASTSCTAFSWSLEEAQHCLMAKTAFPQVELFGEEKALLLVAKHEQASPTALSVMRARGSTERRPPPTKRKQHRSYAVRRCAVSALERHLCSSVAFGNLRVTKRSSRPSPPRGYATGSYSYVDPVTGWLVHRQEPR